MVAMSADVRFADPRSAQARELNLLVSEQDALARRRDELDNERRAAWERAQELSGELATLEHRAARGEKVPAAERSKLEAALAAAKAKTEEPWTERVAGVEAAVREQDGALRRYVADNLGPLFTELAEEAEAAASAVDAACRDLVSAYMRRMDVEAQTTALSALVRIPRPGDISRTHAEQVVMEANRLLESGGEQPPLLRVELRVQDAEDAEDVSGAPNDDDTAEPRRTAVFH
jgi:small-conductance mechanosensitive channel